MADEGKSMIPQQQKAEPIKKSRPNRKKMPPKAFNEISWDIHEMYKAYSAFFASADDDEEIPSNEVLAKLDLLYLKMAKLIAGNVLDRK